MNFEYIIENGEVTITGIKDKSLLPNIIPILIEGCPVIKIDIDNNRYVKCGDIVYLIFNKIGDDYVVTPCICHYIIDNKRYHRNFTIFHSISDATDIILLKTKHHLQYHHI